MLEKKTKPSILFLIPVLGGMFLSGACITPDAINPLGVVRFEEGALSSYTLLTDGYQSLGSDRTSQIILLNHESLSAQWIYDGDDVGGLLFVHNADLEGDEMILSDTSNDRVLIAEATGSILSMNPGFQVIWNSDEDADLGLSYPNDANFLSNGNLLITDRDNHRVIEVDRDTGEIQWQFGVTGQAGSDDFHLNGPHNADRLSDGSTLVADSNNNRILQVDPSGTVIWEYHPTGLDSLSWPRDADKLDNGNVLVTDSRKGRVLEVTPAGETVWQFTISVIGTLSQPYESDQLENGNILISCPGSPSGRIYEVDYSTQEVVWTFPAEDESSGDESSR